MKTKEIAALLGGTVEGDTELDIHGLSGSENAKAGEMTFAVDNERLETAEKGSSSCILTTRATRASKKTLIRVDNPKLAFLIVYNVLNQAVIRERFTHPTATVSASAQIGKNVWIGPNTIIGDEVSLGDGAIIEGNTAILKGCKIGPSCRIYPNVTLYEGVILKKKVIIHGGAVIGADGFGYVKEGGVIYKFPQLGRVIIEDNVEIGANTTIDRGSLSDTIIGANSKIDNLCQIAHNVKTGKNMLMAAQCGVSGSTVLGENVTMGGQVGVIDNAVIGDNATLAARCGVIGDVGKGEIVFGFPARPIAQMKRQLAVLSWLTKNFRALSKSIK